MVKAIFLDNLLNPLIHITLGLFCLRSLRACYACSLSSPRGLGEDLLYLATKSLTICISIYQAASYMLWDSPGDGSVMRVFCEFTLLPVPPYILIKLYHFLGYFIHITFYPQNSSREVKEVLISPSLTGKKIKHPGNEMVF